MRRTSASGCFTPLVSTHTMLLRASAAHPRLRIGWAHCGSHGSYHKDVLACASRHAQDVPPDGPTSAAPPCPLWAMKRRIEDWARLTWDLRGQSNHGRRARPRNSRPGKGGQGKGAIRRMRALAERGGGGGPVNRRVGRDISTIIQPASLMPHSHRRPPFLDAH